MNRTELVRTLSERTDLDAVECSRVLDALAAVTRECAADGTRLHVGGLFTVERVERAARTGRNPQTGEPIDIPAGHGVRMTPAAALKAAAKSGQAA